MNYDEWIEELCNAYDVEELCDLLGISVKDILYAFPEKVETYKQREDSDRGWE